MADIITSLGETKLAQAAGDGTQVEITHIALGDANGTAYDPDFEQTTLVGERARRPIENRIFGGNNSWTVTATFPTDTENFEVREIGFFDQDGDLIALYAGLDVVPRQTGVIEYVVKHVLNFSQVQSGLVVVNAPDDDVHLLSLSTAISVATFVRENLRQEIAIRANARAARDNATAIAENEKRRVEGLFAN